MKYYELRQALSRVVPRMTQLRGPDGVKVGMVQEKGRKKNYHQFDLREKEWKKQERLLNEQEVNSFVEISLRAAACPMPLNLDVWDGLTCPFNCQYCFANAFRASLYTAFFDNSKTLGVRHCNPSMYKRELDKLMSFRKTDPQKIVGDVRRAIAMEIPMRLGIRFEDFLYEEREAGISLAMLNYLADNAYPVMINTKSDLIGEPSYVKALSRNKGKAAVHITMISSDDNILKAIEPGAPSFKQRLEAARNLTSAGVRVVARIEPFLPFVNDDPDRVKEYMELVWKAGVRNITFDTYSYNAWNPGIRQSFINKGYDFDRFFILGCDSQGLGSLLLGAFMDMFRERGFSTSTFDMGNVPDNDMMVCCEVGDWFKDTAGFNHGCSVSAARFIMDQEGAPARWQDFHAHVMSKGGFLSDVLMNDVKHLWNCEGNDAYSHHWAKGIIPAGSDEDGLIWVFNKKEDFRQEVLRGIL